MQFRLTYDGELKSATQNKGRVMHKHEIRRVFHRQLASVWREHPALALHRPGVGMVGAGFEDRMVQYARDGFNWAPLVVKGLLICDLDVLILRRGPPGDFITQGDIDGKLKTLFDALQRPEPGVLADAGITPQEDENPYFYCLLEDDALIVRAKVETDSLFGPLMFDGSFKEESKNDARVIITVSTRRHNQPPS